MADRIILKIFDIVGGPIWVSTDDGQKVFDRITDALKANYSVDLSFANRENLITAFLNAAIGQLYSGEYEEAFLKEHLVFSDISDDDRAMLERAIENAKRYFSNRQAYDQTWEKVVDEE
ncbi:MAG: STAS-like domain-containing protein [Candidatus Contendobacter sp.]|nr:STAS-like domain-containing protein [Candidatus Contendobacter sp.]